MTLYALSRESDRVVLRRAGAGRPREPDPMTGPVRAALGRGASTRQQHGAAALLITLMLAAAMVLAALFVNRNLLFEQRAAANQYRSTQAFEAAEAGLEWALARLNDNARIGPDCMPTSDPTATSFRVRYLAYDPADASFAPRMWLHGGASVTLQSSCVKSASGWDCSCPTQGLPSLPAAQFSGAAPAFTLHFLPGDKPGSVRAVSVGCTHLGGACLAGASSAVDASARVEVAFGLLGALRTPPAAALTVRGMVNAGNASLGVHNPDPGTGLAIHAGAAILAGQARLSGPAGSPLAGTMIGNDSSLAQLAPDRLFAAHFGLDKATWKHQRSAIRIQCPSDCTAALVQAVDDADTNPMIWIDGNLALTGPLRLGSARHPVIIVVGGVAQLDGAITLDGVLYAGNLVWNGAGAVLRGALLSEGNYQGNASGEFQYDTAILAALRGNTGSFARINGSWRDF